MTETAEPPSQRSTLGDGLVVAGLIATAYVLSARFWEAYLSRLGVEGLRVSLGVSELAFAAVWVFPILWLVGFANVCATRMLDKGGWWWRGGILIIMGLAVASTFTSVVYGLGTLFMLLVQAQRLHVPWGQRVLWSRIWLVMTVLWIAFGVCRSAAVFRAENTRVFATITDASGDWLTPSYRPRNYDPIHGPA